VGGRLPEVIRVIRGGGCFWSSRRGCRASYRFDGPPDQRNGDLGFRPVAEAEAVPWEEKDRVLRGGSWVHDARLDRCASRGASDPGCRRVSCGFRLVAEDVGGE